MSDQFGGLPMDQLIGGPLKAACSAQTLLAKASSDFINDVGLNDDGKGNLSARTVDFAFNKPVQAADGTTTMEKVDLQVPLLAIINTPSLSVKEAEVRFTMEVKSSTSAKTTSDTKAELTAHAKYNAGLFSCDVTVHGSVANHSENSRKSDNSAKYDVKVVARDDGPPEGLMKVLDMLNDAIAPTQGVAPAKKV
jgi:hypothetical protein|tara:strand:+ start:3157 stop:3738 length:582 start_codon:yes stop_codon:yes gene_type:complete